MKFLKIKESNGAAEVRMNRPDVRNAFSPDMIEELSTTFRDLAKRKDIFVVTLSGEGSVFCAGADLTWMKESIDYDRKKNETDAKNLFAMFEAINACPQPVIGLVQGAAYGGGLGLIACCDLVIAEEKTKFCFSEVKLGLVPAVISGFVLQKVERAKVVPWMMSGRPFNAKRALSMGLVQEVVDDEVIGERVKEMTRDFLVAGPEAVRATKELLRKFPGELTGDYKAVSTQVIAERRVSPEAQEGLRAFLEKREPSWRKS